MSRFWRRTSIVAACALSLLAAPALTCADETHGASTGAEQAAPAAQPSGDKGTGGCPYATNGTCCGTCQEKMQQGAPAAGAHPDCPCKRAKQGQGS